MSRRHVTSHNVARRAGVSQSVVSRAFRPGAPISEALREKVLRAADELGYTPNAFARGLLHRRTGLVGLAVEDASHPLQAVLLDRLLTGLESLSLAPILVAAHDAAALSAGLARVEAYRPDGILVCGPTLPPALGTRLREDGVPVVLLNRYPAEPGTTAVALTDNRAGGEAMACHLLALGHRHVAIIGGPPGAPAAADRAAGFGAAVRRAGLGSPPEHPGHYSPEGGAAAAAALILLRPRPTALLCCNDLMALGALSALRAAGLRVPEDVSVAGFDGIAAGAWSAPPLTTMQQDLPALVVAALDLLVARLADPDLPPETRLVAPLLRERGSTAALTT
jgi:DNA-binding LacI/PurR family transcriptional regulator